MANKYLALEKFLKICKSWLVPKRATAIIDLWWCADGVYRPAFEEWSDSNEWSLPKDFDFGAPSDDDRVDAMRLVFRFGMRQEFLNEQLRKIFRSDTGS